MFPQDWSDREKETGIQLDIAGQEVSQAGSDWLTDKACGEAGTDIWPIRQKIYEKKTMQLPQRSTRAGWEWAKNNRMIHKQGLRLIKQGVDGKKREAKMSTTHTLVFPAPTWEQVNSPPESSWTRMKQAADFSLQLQGRGNLLWRKPELTGGLIQLVCVCVYGWIWVTVRGSEASVPPGVY